MKQAIQFLAPFAIIALLLQRPAQCEPYAAACYDSTTGAIHAYLTANISVIAFLSTDQLFDNSPPPLLGPLPPTAADNAVLAYFSPLGLPAGLFDLGHVLPPEVSPAAIEFSFAAIGSDSVVDIVSAPGNPAASATYNSTTGELTVNIGPVAQSLLLESEGLFNTSVAPLLSLLAPSQFDANNLMFFNNDAPLPTGTFNLGPVLPPGLDPSQISLATKGNGIAVGIPVTLVPEPAAPALAVVAFSVTLAAGRRKNRASY